MEYEASSAAFIAVDLGSSNGRVMLGIIESGECTLTRVHGWPNVPMRDGELAWDLEELFEETLLGIRKSVEYAAARSLHILGIGVSCWGVDYGRLDSAGTVLLPVKHHRGADHEMPERSATLISPDVSWYITGVLDQAINTAHQLRSDAENGRLSSDQTAVLLPDLWVYRLTGTVAAERTIASTTALLDRETSGWSERLLSELAIDITLPQLVDDGQFAGVTMPGITSRVGAAEPLPVYFVAGHDTASAFLTVPTRSDEMSTGVVAAGSWAVTGIETENAVFEGAAEAGFTNELGASGRNLLIRNLSGMWLLQECVRSWREDHGETLDIIELVAAAAKVTQPGVFDVSDPELQKPGNLPQRIADRCEQAGYPRPSSEPEIVRVIIHSLAVAYRSTLSEAARVTGRRIDRIRIIGGGSKNTLLCRETAETTGLPVEAGPAEATSLGIVFRLAVASGHLDSMDAARALALPEEAVTTYYPSSAKEVLL